MMNLSTCIYILCITDRIILRINFTNKIRHSLWFSINLGEIKIHRILVLREKDLPQRLVRVEMWWKCKAEAGVLSVESQISHHVAMVAEVDWEPGACRCCHLGRFGRIDGRYRGSRVVRSPRHPFITVLSLFIAHRVMDLCLNNEFRFH